MRGTEKSSSEEEMTEAREEKTVGCDEGSKRKQQSGSGTDSPSIGESGSVKPSSTESSSSKRCRRECSSSEPYDSKSASEESSSSNGSSSDSGEETWRQRSSTSSESPDPQLALESIPGESGSSERESLSNSKEETTPKVLVRYNSPSSVSTIESVSRKSCSSSGSSSSGSSSSDSAGEMRRRTLGRRSPSDSSDPESDWGSE